MVSSAWLRAIDFVLGGEIGKVVPMSVDQDVIKEFAMSLIGLPYLWGGQSPIEALDCSGLTINILQAAGVFPDHQDASAQDLFARFTKGGRPQFGALTFYGRSIDKVTHVGFMLTDTLMLEAGGGGSAITDRAAAIKANAFVRVRPYNLRTDLIAIRLPDYPWNQKAP